MSKATLTANAPSFAVRVRRVQVGSKWRKADLAGANLNEAKMQEVDLLGANLAGTKLERVVWGEKAVQEVQARAAEKRGDPAKRRWPSTKRPRRSTGL